MGLADADDANELSTDAELPCHLEMGDVPAGEDQRELFIVDCAAEASRSAERSTDWQEGATVSGLLETFDAG